MRRHPLTPTAEVLSPETDVIADEQRREIAAAVAALPRRQRECVVLRYFSDCSVIETARALGISEGAVKQHVHRAMASLADALRDDLDGVS